MAEFTEFLAGAYQLQSIAGRLIDAVARRLEATGSAE